MLQLDQTGTDRGALALAEEALKGWAHDPRSATVVRMSSNVVVRFTQDGQRRILRLTPAARRSFAEVSAEIAYVEHLAAGGVRANRPVAAYDGAVVRTVKNASGPFQACVLEYMNGDELELDDLSPAMMEAWGVSLGMLHAVSAGWPTAGRPMWKTTLADVRASLKPDDVIALRALTRIEVSLETLLVETTNYGLIHGDFELDNLQWNNGVPSIIDFDDCAGSWYVMDIACALRDLWDDRISHIDLAAPPLLSFVHGYRSVHSLTDEELARIPLFLGLHTLVTYAELCGIVSKAPSPSEPDWVVKIRERLRNKIALYAEELGHFTESRPD
ncbi:MAG: phosphotransferase enzyme family protein [Candidatus Cryosericum sp.]